MATCHCSIRLERTFLMSIIPGGVSLILGKFVRLLIRFSG